MPASHCTIAEHNAMKSDAVWPTLEHIGFQQTETDEGDVAWLELRNCSCGSTLAVLVLMRDAQSHTATVGKMAGAA